MITSIYYPTSTTYNLGQSMAFSQDQGSTYLGMAYTEPLSFTARLSVTEPINPAVLTPTVANYPVTKSPFFMGSFDGFWIHKLYVADHMVASLQTVNQQFFAPIYHDRVESVSMGTLDLQPCTSRCDDDVPAPGALMALCVSAVLFSRRNRA